jgi:hypothetical protein
MVPRLHKLHFALIALAPIRCASIAYSDELLKISPGFAMTMKVPGVDQTGITAIARKAQFLGRCSGILSPPLVQKEDRREGKSRLACL